MGYIKVEERNQLVLFPESIDEYITQDNTVRVIEAYVEQLNLKELGFKKVTCAPTPKASL